MLDLDAPTPAGRHGTPRSLILRDAQGAPLGGTDAPATLELVGRYSPAYQRASAVQIQRLALETRFGIPEGSIEQRIAARDDALEILVACVVGWRNIARSGEPAPCTAESVRELLKGYPPARAQVEAFVHNDGNFPPAAPESAEGSADG